MTQRTADLLNFLAAMAIGDYVIRIDTLSVRHDSAEIELGHSGS